MRILKILSLLCITFSLAMCGSKDDNTSSSQSTLWDSNSLKFNTSSFGGTGPSPAPVLALPTNIKCQKDSFSYGYENGILTKSTCIDATVGYQDVDKNLSAAEISELQVILGNVQFLQKAYSGEPCPQDGPGTSGGFIQVYQADETVKIIDTTSEAPCGDDSGKYIRGQVENLDFLSEVDALLN